LTLGESHLEKKGTRWWTNRVVPSIKDVRQVWSMRGTKL